MNSHSKDRVRGTTQNGFRLSGALPRVMTGVTAASAALAAALYIFGPFSDLSARQLAAGPHSTEIGPGNTPLVLAQTGRSWGGLSKHAEHEPGTSLAVVAKADSLAGTLPSRPQWQRAERTYGPEPAQRATQSKVR